MTKLAVTDYVQVIQGDADPVRGRITAINGGGSIDVKLTDEDETELADVAHVSADADAVATADEEPKRKGRKSKAVAAQAGTRWYLGSRNEKLDPAKASPTIVAIA